MFALVYYPNFYALIDLNICKDQKTGKEKTESYGGWFFKHLGRLSRWLKTESKKSKGSKEINICKESELPYGHKVQYMERRR